MPVQLANIQKRRRVKLINAGGERQILCFDGEKIDLKAELNDITNLRNLEITWEQVKGNPVTINDGNKKDASFTSNDRSDKKFRLFLDKDSQEEQSDVFEVFYTPTSRKYISKRVGGYNGTATALPEFSKQTGSFSPVVDGSFYASAISPVGNLYQWKNSENVNKIEVFFQAFGSNSKNLVVTYEGSAIPQYLISNLTGWYTFVVTSEIEGITKKYSSDRIGSTEFLLEGEKEPTVHEVFTSKTTNHLTRPSEVTYRLKFIKLGINESTYDKSGHLVSRVLPSSVSRLRFIKLDVGQRSGVISSHTSSGVFRVTSQSLITQRLDASQIGSA